jgi:hypothetical protein
MPFIYISDPRKVKILERRVNPLKTGSCRGWTLPKWADGLSDGAQPERGASAYQTQFWDRTSVRNAVLIIHDFILPLRLSLAG